MEGFKVDLSDQIALVTGASQGLGRAVAIALGEAGARVACVARNVDKLNSTVQAITDAGGKAEAFGCDVTDRESVDKVVEQVAETWSEEMGRKKPNIDILVNNAGILINHGNVQAKLSTPDCGNIATRASTKDNEIKILLAHETHSMGIRLN